MLALTGTEEPSRASERPTTTNTFDLASFWMPGKGEIEGWHSEVSDRRLVSCPVLFETRIRDQPIAIVASQKFDRLAI